MADTVEVSDVNEQDRDQTERVLAAELARAILSADPGSGAPVGFGEAAWHSIVAASIGAGLSAFIIRSAFDFLNQAGVAGAGAARIVDEIAPEVRDQMISDIAEGLAGTYGSAAELARPSTPSTPGAGTKPTHETSSDVYRRVRVGSARLAQTGTTRAREMVRSHLAEGLGATQNTWRTRKDDRVRLTHGALEGETRPTGEPFVTLSGASLLYPGDPSAPIGETANCRCHLTYLVPATVRVFQRGDQLVELSNPGVGPDIRSERVVPV